MIKERVDLSIFNIKNPAPPPPEPTKEDLENMKAELQGQINELQVRINAKAIIPE